MPKQPTIPSLRDALKKKMTRHEVFPAIAEDARITAMTKAGSDRGARTCGVE